MLSEKWQPFYLSLSVSVMMQQLPSKLEKHLTHYGQTLCLGLKEWNKTINTLKGGGAVCLGTDFVLCHKICTQQ